MSTGWHQLTWADRLKIEVLVRAGKNQAEIARLIGCNRSTICRELKRGRYQHTTREYLDPEERYSPEMAQQKRDETNANRGVVLKIGNDLEYANYLEEKILGGLSPAAVLGELKAKGEENRFKTRICVTTLYSYIDKGVFLLLSNKNLLIKGRPKKNRKKKIQRAKRANAGTSIEKRPEEIDKREEFGHWEMDSVVGPQGKSKSTMLTMTERKTRKEIIFHLPNHTAEAVVNAVDTLEKKWGNKFSQIFKTITVDNGSEFAFFEALEKSVDGQRKRTSLYYCHPFCSSERGTNENQNRMIRRKVPKGTNFDKMTDEELQSIEDWMNNYPRRILGYSTAAEEFEEELARITA